MEPFKYTPSLSVFFTRMKLKNIVYVRNQKNYNITQKYNIWVLHLKKLTEKMRRFFSRVSEKP